MEHVLSARLELKDKFTSVISKAEKGLAGLYQKAKSMNWEKVNSGLNKFGTVAIGGLAGIGAIAGSSLTAFADLEDQVKRNKAIMGATAAEENMLMAQTRTWKKYKIYSTRSGTSSNVSSNGGYEN